MFCGWFCGCGDSYSQSLRRREKNTIVISYLDFMIVLVCYCCNWNDNVAGLDSGSKMNVFGVAVVSFCGVVKQHDKRRRVCYPFCICFVGDFTALLVL